MNKQPSIMSFFSLLSASILLMAFVAIGSMTYGLAAQNSLQLHFMNRMAAAETIQADLYEMKTMFSAFIHDWSEDGYADYTGSCEKLNRNLEQYRSFCQDAPTTLNYIRRLNNFNSYQQQRIQEVLAGGDTRYRTYLYVTNGLESHHQQALEMAQQDMLIAGNDYKDASKAISQRILWMMVILVLAALLMGGLLLQFSVRTKQILNDMTDYFGRLVSRDWATPDLSVFQYREFTLISQTSNWMKKEIINYIKEIQNQAKLEKQLHEERLINEQQHAMLIAAQMSALRAQVNPHFLFNALNLIGVTALMDTSDAVMQLVEATGKILRYSLYHKELLTTLDEELEIVTQYLFLQKCRFGKIVRFEVYNELEGEEFEIPTMSIQPIVENCFKHGFGNKKCLNIYITVTLVDKMLSICVEDDGVGFLPEQIQTESTDGIGLNNIKKRLELMYGEAESWMKIESEAGAYSRITLLLPQREI